MLAKATILLLTITYSISKSNTLLDLKKNTKNIILSLLLLCLNNIVPSILIMKVDFSLLFRPIN